MNAPKLRFKEFNDEWKIYTVGDITESLKSGLSRLLQHQDIGIPVIRANNIENGKLNYNDLKYWYVNDPQGADTSNYLVHKNDILINFINSEAKMGTAAIVANEPFREMIYTTNILKMNTNSLADNYFFYCYTDSKKYKDYIKLITKPAVNQASFTTVDFKKHKITLPTIKEQIKIASFFEEIDKKIQLQQEKMDLLKEQKKGYMQKIFTQELRFKDEDGKPFPQWEKGILSDLVTIIGGGTPSSDEPSYWGGEYQWFIPTEITQKYSTFSNRTITKLGLEKSSAKLLPTGTILLTSRATLGEMSILLNEACTNQGFQSLVPNKKTISEFIYTLQPQIKKYCYKNASGSTFLEISKSTLEKMPIMIPALKEQIRIAALAENLDKRIQYEFDKLEVLKIQKQAFMQQMFI